MILTEVWRLATSALFLPFVPLVVHLITVMLQDASNPTLAFWLRKAHPCSGRHPYEDALLWVISLPLNMAG